MLNQTPIREPHIRRLVHDFDALADELHHLIDVPPGPRQEAVSGGETEFTTEWQMVATAEDAETE